MARADLLVKMFRSVSSDDQSTFRRLADAVIQEEKAKGHQILAERLTKALMPYSSRTRRGLGPRESKSNGQCQDLFYEIIPERTLDSLVLSDATRSLITGAVEEQHRAELLHSYNLRACNRILLAGPPGNGKTSLAEALAHELMYPLVVIRYETLVGSYLGETSGRLMRVLEHAKTQRCVLFFDEFETLGKERGDTNETGEIKRVVSSLLLQIDALPDYVVIVAASNHPELLDRAVWRRFQLHIELPAPSRRQLTQHIEAISKRCRVHFGYASETLARRMQGVNFSEVEEFCLSVVRRAVLDGNTDNAKSITKLKLEQWQGRSRVVSSGRVKGE